jgi:2-methylcitrate dehydratase PrpD
MGSLLAGPFCGQILADPRLREMIARVKIVNDQDLNSFYPPAPISEVEIRATDGRAFAGRQLHPKGSHLRPFAAGEHRAKMVDLAAIALGPDAAESLVQAILALRGPERVRELATRTRRAGRLEAAAPARPATPGQE